MSASVRHRAARFVIMAALAATLGLAPASRVRAQSVDPTDSLNTTPVPSAAVRAGTDTLFVLVPLRETAEIQKALEAARIQRSEAETQTARSRVLQARSRTELDVQKTRLDALQAQLKLAKQSKDDTRKTEIESLRSVAQLERRLLERRDALRQQEIDVAVADRELADATAKAREAEFALALKREQHARVASAPGSTTVERQTVERELQSLERRALRAQIDEAQHREDHARRGSELAKSQLEVFEAQVKLLQNGGSLK